ncbi:MAG: uL15 family ribosomal protein [Candidatus Azambacteria bacterium]|nr:uL15 family ribosomal protein [Candidatus Azambacteria bacterium]
MQLHQIKPVHKPKKGKRIGRGGKRGGYSGRGIKGQKSRAGAGIRPAIRDVMMRFPKQRGRAKHSFKSLFEKPVVLNLFDIEKIFSAKGGSPEGGKAGEIVSPQTLFEKGVIRKKEGKLPEIKILGTGEISKKLNFQEVLLSASARDKIQKAGGSIK